MNAHVHHASRRVTRGKGDTSVSAKSSHDYQLDQHELLCRQPARTQLPNIRTSTNEHRVRHKPSYFLRPCPFGFWRSQDRWTTASHSLGQGVKIDKRTIFKSSVSTYRHTPYQLPSVSVKSTSEASGSVHRARKSHPLTMCQRSAWRQAYTCCGMVRADHGGRNAIDHNLDL